MRPPRSWPPALGQSLSRRRERLRRRSEHRPWIDLDLGAPIQAFRLNGHRPARRPAFAAQHIPDDAEVAGLLALMLLNEARRPARTGPAGELVPLAEQDRSRRDRALIEEGVALVSAALPKGAVGEYKLQAAIAAVHDEAEAADETDWPQILALYGLLERMTGNPMVALNRAVAAAMVEGPAAGLALLEGLDERLAGHTASTRCVRTCSGWTASGRGQARTTGQRPGERRAWPNGTTC